MASRAERRRRDREDRKGQERVSGVSKRYLQLAQDELGGQDADDTADERRDTFVGLLKDWRATQQALAEFRAGYQRAKSLMGKGRKGIDLKPLEERYAQLLEERDLIEDQMADCLDSEEANVLLSSAHIHAATGLVLRVPDDLADRLAREVHGTGEEGPSPAGGTAEISGELAGQSSRG